MDIDWKEVGKAAAFVAGPPIATCAVQFAVFRDPKLVKWWKKQDKPSWAVSNNTLLLCTDIMTPGLLGYGLYLTQKSSVMVAREKQASIAAAVSTVTLAGLSIVLLGSRRLKWWNWDRSGLQSRGSPYRGLRSPLVVVDGPLNVSPVKMLCKVHCQIEQSTSPAKRDFWDQNAALIVRGSIIATGLTGVIIFTRSLRLFTRFEHLRQIPASFVSKNIRLRGEIHGVTDQGVLRVLHEPIYRLPAFRRKADDAYGKLSVSVAGVEIGEKGVEWMKGELLPSVKSPTPKFVSFALIKRQLQHPDIIECEVFARKPSRIPWLNYSLNVELIRLGFARVPGCEINEHMSALRSNPAYSRLVSKLILSENVADSRGVGMWQRDTWVESVQAYPSQVTSLVRHSAWFRIGSGSVVIIRDALFITWNIINKLAHYTAAASKSVYRVGSNVYSTISSRRKLN